MGGMVLLQLVDDIQHALFCTVQPCSASMEGVRHLLLAINQDGQGGFCCRW